MKICPKCGKVISYNSYFGAYICTDCKWEDATIGVKRNKGVISYKVSFRKQNKVFDNHKVLVIK